MKIKDNFPLEKLKDFGFKTGEELIKENEIFLEIIYSYQHSYYFFYEPNLTQTIQSLMLLMRMEILWLLLWCIQIPKE